MKTLLISKLLNQFRVIVANAKLLLLRNQLPMIGAKLVTMSEEEKTLIIERIVKGVIARTMNRFVYGSVAALVAVSIWVGTMQATQLELKQYKDMSEPTRVEAIKALEGISVQLDGNGNALKRIEKSQIEHIKDFNAYKDKTAENIQNFYRNNPSIQ